jgi:hypothetical protein
MRVQLADNAVAWYEDEIDQWVEERIRGAGKRPASKARPVQTAAPAITAEEPPPKRPRGRPQKIRPAPEDAELHA